MKYNYIKAAVIALFATATSAQAQTISTFEALNIPADSFWDGRNQEKSFTNGNAYFSNYYDFGYWLGGWAVSTQTDTTAEGENGTFTAITGKGASNSATYALGQNGSIINLQGAAAKKQVYGTYITNNNFAYHSMLKGDQFTKKFGGVSGNDPDYFILTFKAWLNGTMKTDSINFYLADFRDADNSKDYIVKDWNFIDLTPLGNVDSIQTILSSSDMGQFGMNTPAFFAMDDFTTYDRGVGIAKIQQNAVNVYPNPAQNILNISYTGAIENISVADITGREVFTAAGTSQINVEALNNGTYILQVKTAEGILTSRFVKQ